MKPFLMGVALGIVILLATHLAGVRDPAAWLLLQ